jgi:hypothetical protein
VRQIYVFDKVDEALEIPHLVIIQSHVAAIWTIEVEVAGIQTQRLSDLLDLVDKPWQLPKFRRIRLVGVGRAELVVVVVLDSGMSPHSGGNYGKTQYRQTVA